MRDRNSRRRLSSHSIGSSNRFVNRHSVSRKDSNQDRFMSSDHSRTNANNKMFGSRHNVSSQGRSPGRFVSSVLHGSNAMRSSNPDLNRGNRIKAGTINRIESSMTGKRGNA